MVICSDIIVCFLYSRNIVWSDDSQLLALTFSDGAVEVCDTVGKSSAQNQQLRINVVRTEPVFISLPDVLDVNLLCAT